jgi:hypothetical protein
VLTLRGAGRWGDQGQIYKEQRKNWKGLGGELGTEAGYQTVNTKAEAVPLGGRGAGGQRSSCCLEGVTFEGSQGICEGEKHGVG